MVKKSLKKTLVGWQMRFVSWILVLALILSLMPMSIIPVQAASGTLLGDISNVDEDKTFESANENTKAYIITTTKGEKVRIVFYKNDLFRIWLADDGKGNFTESDPNDLPTNQMWDLGGISDVGDLEIVVKKNFGALPNAGKSNSSGYYDFKTDSLILRAYSSPFRFEMLDASGKVVWSEANPIMMDSSSTTQTLDTSDSEYFFGGGMQVGYFSHKGRKIDIARGGWTPGQAPNPVPFYMSTEGYGVFRNTFKDGVYDFTSNNQISLSHDEKRFDAYYFYGPSFEKILDGYTELTGRPSLIPRWSMGLGDASAYRQKTDTTAEGGNPANAGTQTPSQAPYGGFWSDKGTVGAADDYVSAYLNKDMPLGWMLPNDGYGCEYNKQTHPKGSLGDAASSLMEHNIRTGLWVGEPRNYTDTNYTYGYPNSIKDETSITAMDQKKAAFVKEITAQVKDWLVRLYKIDVAWSGTKGLKGDLGIFNQMYNNIEQNSGDRGMIITVFGWAGAQRYATIWSGDQSGTNDYVQYHIPTFLGASMSGFPFYTSDQGSIFHDNPGVYVRDLQMKTLVPLNYAMNNWGNSTTSGNPPTTRSTSDKRPGSSIHFTTEEIDSNRKYLKLKQQLVPYLYSYARQSYEKGTPVVRPMVYNYQNDPATYDTRTQYQYMSGDWILAAPVYDPAATVRDNIYLPAGRWIDYWSGEEYFGPTTISVDAPMDKLPMFIRAGAVIPMNQESLYDGQEEYNGKTVNNTKIFDLYPEGTTTFKLYEDDGHSIKYKTENAYKKTLITSSAPLAGITGPLTVTVGAAEGNGFEGQVTERKNMFMIHTPVKPGDVKLGGESGTSMSVYTSYASLDTSANGGWFYDASDKGGVLYVKTASLSTSAATSIWVDKFIANGAPELETALPLAENVRAAGVAKDTISVSWDAIPGATNYSIEIDGQTIIDNVSSPYLHTCAEAESTHKYRIIGKNATQKSGWTVPVLGTSLADPDFYMIPKSGMSATCSNTTDYGGGVVEQAIDGDVGSQFHTGTSVSGNENMDLNLGGLFMLDKFVYTPRADKGNGTVNGYTLYTSLNGVDYTQVAKGTWTYDASEKNALTSKTVTFTPTLAKYLRFQKNISIGNFFSAQEVYVYRSQKNIVMSSLTTGKEASASSVWSAPAVTLDKVTGLSATAADADTQTGGGYVASLAVDGVANDSKGWRITPGHIPATLNIDLPGAAEICNVKYYPLPDACEKRDELGERGGDVIGYALYAVDANDKTVWLAGGTWESGIEPKTINFRPINAKSLQFEVTSGKNGVGAVAEFEVYKEHTEEPVSHAETSISADKMTATANSVGEDSQPQGVITGAGWQSDYGNDWNSARWPAWVNIKFNTPKAVTRIDYTPRAGSNGRIKGYKVMYSTDNGATYFEGGRGIGQDNANKQKLEYNHPYPVTDIKIQSEVFDELLQSVSGTNDTSYAYGNGGNWFIQKLEFYEDATLISPDPNPNTAVAQDSWTVDAASDPEAGLNPELLKDNDKTTFWASEYGKPITDPTKWPAYVTIDLGAEKLITKVEYTPRQNSSNGRLRGYKVLASADGENYSLAGQGYAFNTTAAQDLEYNFKQPVRYIRIQNDVFGTMASKLDTTNSPPADGGAYSYGSGNQISIAELNFYTSNYSGGTVGNLGPEPSYEPKYAVDDRNDTGWSSADGQSAVLTVDLGTSKTFDMARVLWGREFGTGYTLEASEDGSSWSNLTTVANNTFDEGYYKFTPVTARYVRINGTASNKAFTVKAFDIFGDDGVTSITLNPSTAHMDVGDELTLQTEISPATARDQTLSWSSSDPEIASVDPFTGKIRALKPGNVTVTATSAAEPDVKATCELTVNSVPVGSLTAIPSEKVMGVGESVQLELVVAPNNATNTGVTWTSDNTDVATVLPSGFVTAIAKGTAVITAKSEDDPSKTATFNVTVGDIQSLNLNNNSGTLEVTFDTIPTEVKKILFAATYNDSTGEQPLSLVNMAVNSAANTVAFNYDKFLPNSQSRVDVTVKYKNGVVKTQAVTVGKAYTLTFDSQNAEVEASPNFKKVILPATEIDELPLAPTKTGYKFGGWYTAKNGGGTAFDEKQAINEDITVYAMWIPNQQSITFDSNGGSAIDPVKANYNSLLAEPTSPILTGYRLVGWYKDSSLTIPWDFATDIVKSDFTLYAKWIATFTVTFFTDGGSSIDNIKVDSGALINKPNDPIYTGKAFTAWYKDENLTALWNFDADTVITDITLYARWVTTGNSIVIFDSNGGSAVASQTLVNGQKLASITPARFGYLFTGWYKDNACTERWNFNSDFVTADMILYAGWESMPTPVFHYSFNNAAELGRIGAYGLTLLTSHTQSVGQGVNNSGALSMAAGGNIRIDNNAFDYKTQPFTISFWVNPVSVAAQQYLLTSNPGDDWILVKAGGMISLYLDGVVECTNTVISAGQWTQLTFVQSKNPDKFIVYVNGVKTESFDIAPAFGTPAQGNYFSLGAKYNATAGNFNGKMDEVRFYEDTALSDAQVKAIYDIDCTYSQVTDIVGVQSVEKNVTLNLDTAFIVLPENATNKAVIWNLKDDGATGATLNGSVLSTSGAGITVITASVKNGLSTTSDFIKDITITVTTCSGIIANISDLRKTYDAAAVGETTYTYNGDGAVTVTYHEDNNGVIGAQLGAAPVNAGSYWVKISAAATNNYSAAEGTARFTISKAASTPPSVSGLTGTSGQQLSTVSLESYVGLSWKNPATILAAGTQNYEATYIQNNNAVNYQPLTVLLQVIVSGGGSDNGSTTPAPAPKPALKPELPIYEETLGNMVAVSISASATINADGSATAALSAQEAQRLVASIEAAKAALIDDKKLAVTINSKITGDVKNASIVIPSIVLDSVAKIDARVNVDIGGLIVEFDSKAIDTINDAAKGSGVTVTAAKIENSTFPVSVTAVIGNRPVYEFSVRAGNSSVSDFMGGKAVITLTAALNTGEDPNCIVAYYIHESGKLLPVRSRYDKESSQIQITAYHFSKYAVGYNPVEFSDVAKGNWFKPAVDFIAARGITSGTGNGNFGSRMNITRADFIVMLLKAYNIDTSSTPTDNFIDAGNKYYTAYLAVAKKMGIASGTGNNKFNPEVELTREEMFALVYKTLVVMNELPKTEKADISIFSDANQVSSYFTEATQTLMAAGIIKGSNGKLNPKATASRAEMAQVLYELLK